MSYIGPVLRQRSAALSAGISIVRRVLERESFPNGFTSAQLFKVVVKEPPPPGFEPYVVSKTAPAPEPVTPPKKSKRPLERTNIPRSTFHPEHPVRSITFLKKLILPTLAGHQEIKMSIQPKANFAAQAEAEAETAPKAKGKKQKTSHMEWVWKVLPPEQRFQAPTPPPKKAIVGQEVGVGADFSHLNKRRQRGRVKKISQAVVRMKEYRGRNELNAAAAESTERPTLAQ